MQMLSPDDLSPDHLWLSTRFEYRGHGRAEFANPKGCAEGPTTATFDERGHGTISMRVETLESERPLQLGGMEFFSGRQPVRDGNAISISIGSDDNPCTRLEIYTADGRYVAEGEEIVYGRSGNLLASQTEQTLTFHPRRSRFDSLGATSPKYWVLPLTNFVTPYSFYHGGVDEHPLRLRTWVEPVEHLPEDQKEVFRLRAWASQPIVLFEWGGRLCFIEALPDYRVRNARLARHEQRRLITAVMVGDLRDRARDLDALERWVPTDALSALGFATGVDVGAPWLELRDEVGSLVSRVHINYHSPIYASGRPLINEAIHGGLGLLLTRFLAMPQSLRLPVHVAMRQVTRAGLQNQTLEDQFYRLAVGTEGLCSALRLTRYSLKKQLSKSNAEKIDAELDRTKRAIAGLAERAEVAGNHGESEALLTMARKVGQSTSANKNFGQLVSDLAAHCNLPDPGVVRRHYDEHPRDDGRDWITALTMYRGATVHGVGFDIAGGKHNIDDLIRYGRHLHDLLARAILTVVGYEGQYQPVVTIRTASQPVEWVSEDTEPAELGYGVEP